MVGGAAADNYYVGILIKWEQGPKGLETGASQADCLLTASSLIVNLAKRISGSVFHVARQSKSNSTLMLACVPEDVQRILFMITITNSFEFSG